MQTKTSWLVLTLIVLFLSAETFGQKVGALDPFFGQGGKQLTGFGSNLKYINALVEQEDGKIIVAGSLPIQGANRIVIGRLKADGSLDHSFGNLGMIITRELSYVSSLVISDNGLIYVGGSASNGSNEDFAVLCLNEKGRIHHGYGSLGIQKIDCGGAEKAEAMAITEDGKLVLAGQGIPRRGKSSHYLMVRLTENGAPDPEFGVEGMMRMDLGSYDRCSDMVIQPDGKIVIAGYSKMGEFDEFAVLRVLENGIPDFTFGEEGHQTIPVGTSNDCAKSIALQEDGKILVAGNTMINEGDYDYVLLRLNTDGSPDLNFGILSIQDFDLGPNDFLAGLKVQADQKILIAGSSGNEFTVVRFNQGGDLDKTFFGKGYRQIHPGNNAQIRAGSLLLQEDGKVLLAGVSQNEMIMLRLQGNPNLPGLAEVLRHDWNEVQGGSKLGFTLAGGIELAALVQLMEAPVDTKHRKSSRMGLSNSKNKILVSAYLKIGPIQNLKVVIDQEQKAHFYAGESFLITAKPNNDQASILITN